MDKDLAIPSKKTEFLNNNQLGEITQCEVSIEGRLIITLEKEKKTLKIWYNDYDTSENGPFDGKPAPLTHKPSSYTPFQVSFDF